jgi:hypothetical protein
VRDLPAAHLVEQRVERDELPGDQRDDHVQRDLGVAEPVLLQEAEVQGLRQRGEAAEVRVEQGFPHQRDAGRGQQQRQHVQRRVHRSVALPARGEQAERDRDRRLHDPAEDHHLGRDDQRLAG